MEIRTIQVDDKQLQGIIERLHENNVKESSVFSDDVFDLLKKSVDNSDESYVVTADDEPAVVYGISKGSALSRRGFPWLVCTDRINDVGITFLRQFRKKVNEYKKEFNYLESTILKENIEVIKMLEWVGFSQGETITHNDHEFVKMIWEVDNDVR